MHDILDANRIVNFSLSWVQNLNDSTAYVAFHDWFIEGWVNKEIFIVFLREKQEHVTYGIYDIKC